MRLTRKQAAIIGARTGITFGPFDDIHEYAATIYDGDISTLGMLGIASDLKEKSTPDVFAIAATREGETEAMLKKIIAIVTRDRYNPERAPGDVGEHDVVLAWLAKAIA